MLGQIALILSISLTSPADLSATDKQVAIESLSKSMIERYVSKAKADEVSAALAQNLKAGKYEALKTGEEFAQQVTKDVNAICRDAHLWVRYSEKVLPVRASNAEPSPQEQAAQAKYVRLTNAAFEEVKRLGGNVGYIRFFGFMDPAEAARPIRSAMAFVENTDALIFDIRDNGGGSPETVRLLCNYLFDKPTHLNSLIFRRGDKMVTTDFITEKISDPVYHGKPIFVLVSKRTGSGAEEFAYNLQTQKRATIIGENTWGGANPGGTVRLNDHFMAFIPVGMAKNPITGTNWEGTGVTPDVKAIPADALKTGHILAIKALLEKATGDDATRLQGVLKELGG